MGYAVMMYLRLLPLLIVALPLAAQTAELDYVCEITGGGDVVAFDCTYQSEHGIDFRFAVSTAAPEGEVACSLSGAMPPEAERVSFALDCSEYDGGADFRVHWQQLLFDMEAYFDVVALSRPFGAIILDAKIQCDDGTYYMGGFMPGEGASTAPLGVGQRGAVSFDVTGCPGTWEAITLSPRFPEWRCDGCGTYEQSQLIGGER